MQIDHDLIQKLHAAARRERAEYLRCLFIRAKPWLRSLLPQGGTSLRAEPCC